MRGANVEVSGAAPGSPPPALTTIAWRMMHIAVGSLATRTSAFFSDSDLPDEVSMWDSRREPAELPGTAFLEKHYQAWYEGISALDDTGLRAPLGPKGASFADEPMAALIVHINREFIHHGAEIALLRDLYRAR